MPNRFCGDVSGSLTKAGELCKFILPEGEDFCQHHSADKTRQQATIEKCNKALREAKIPNVETRGFQSPDDCLRVRAKVVEILCKDKVVDFRRLDMILKAATGASGDHATKAQEEQNRLLLMLDGHGAGLAVLQRLHDAPVRVLPGRKRMLDLKLNDIDVTPTSQEAS